MKDIIFKGCGTAIVTPFDEEGNIDFDEFRKLVDFQIDNKINAIIVCGTTGESSTLTIEEKNELIRYCVKVVNKRVPVIAGIGSNNTKTVIENEKYAERVGDQAVIRTEGKYSFFGGRAQELEKRTNGRNQKRTTSKIRRNCWFY